MLARLTGFLTGVVLSCAVLAGAASPALAVSSPDLTASISNNVSGTTTLGQNWTWTIHVGNAPATSVAMFNSGATVLSDDLDASGDLVFGTPVMTNASGGVTGTVSCSIASNTLSCTANGAVQIQPGGGFDITLPVTPMSAGVFQNPRLHRICQVDPLNVVAESDNTNNDCPPNGVQVRAPDLSVGQSDDAFGQVNQGSAWHWVLTVANTGNADATFAPGTTIVQDDLDNSGGLAYGQPTVQGVNAVTNWGNIACSISSAKRLTCTASGSPVTMSSGTGTFDVSILVTPSQKGVYTSPRTSGSCTADPNSAILESNETNNDCRLGGTRRGGHRRRLQLRRPRRDRRRQPRPECRGRFPRRCRQPHAHDHRDEPRTRRDQRRHRHDRLRRRVSPPGAQLDTATPSAGSYDSANRIWTIGSLANNAQATLTLTFSVATGTANDATVTTHAKVEPPEFQFIGDPDSSDDEATVATGVQDSGVVQTVGVTPSSKDFGSQRVGTMSTAQTFTITNHDSATLNIATVALVGTNPDQFSDAADTCSNQAILPSHSCTVAVAFTPTTTGAQTANLEITSDALSGPTEIILHGSGTQSVISASPSSASFGNETVNKTSTPQDFQITNNGTATLQIGLVTLGGNDASQYVESSDGCSHAALNAGQSCTVSLAFRPTSTGAQNDATLDIASDDPGGTFHIALSGSGVAPTVSAGPLSKNFGSQPINSTGAAQTFQIKNTGNAALTISSISARRRRRRAVHDVEQHLPQPARDQRHLHRRRRVRAEDGGSAQQRHAEYRER